MHSWSDRSMTTSTRSLTSFLASATPATGSSAPHRTRADRSVTVAYCDIAAPFRPPAQPHPLGLAAGPHPSSPPVTLRPSSLATPPHPSGPPAQPSLPSLGGGTGEAADPDLAFPTPIAGQAVGSAEVPTRSATACRSTSISAAAKAR